MIREKRRSALTKLALFCLASLLSTAWPSQAASWKDDYDAGKKAYDEGRYTDAEKLYLAAAEEAQKFGEDDLRLAATVFNLGVLYYVQQRYTDAEQPLKRAVAIIEAAQGSEHPPELMTTQGPLGDVLLELAEDYRAMHRFAEAEPLYKRALDISEKAINAGQIQMATVYLDLASTYAAQSRYGDAESLYVKALAIFEKALGPEHIAVAWNLFNLAELYQAEDKWADAEPYNKQAIAVFEKVGGPESPNLALGLESYARLLRKTKRKDEAEKMETRAKQIRLHNAQKDLLK